VQRIYTLCLSSAVIIGQLSDMWFHCPGFSSTTLQFKKEPLVPIGCLATAYFLASGIKSFQNQDPRRGQKMMRARELFRRVLILFLPSSVVVARISSSPCLDPPQVWRRNLLPWECSCITLGLIESILKLRELFSTSRLWWRVVSLHKSRSLCLFSSSFHVTQPSISTS
jgi:Hypoxia induced protein conserved region